MHNTQIDLGWQPAAALWLALAATAAAWGQDAPGCQDPSLVTRMPSFELYACESAWNEAAVVTGPTREQTVEGQRTVYRYALPDGPKPPSRLQILRNYEAALLAKGGEKLYFQSRDDGDGPVGATFRVRSQGATHWLSFDSFVGTQAQTAGYNLAVTRIESMAQDVQAGELQRSLDAGQKVALYIHFDTGRATVRQESLPIVGELHKLLVANPTLRIALEGHTDNVGARASNVALSAQRAASVKQALVARGVAADRVQTAGHGPDKPLADNGAEEGRAKNRRVEIRKL